MPLDYLALDCLRRAVLHPVLIPYMMQNRWVSISVFLMGVDHFGRLWRHDIQSRTWCYREVPVITIMSSHCHPGTSSSSSDPLDSHSIYVRNQLVCDRCIYNDGTDIYFPVSSRSINPNETREPSTSGERTRPAEHHDEEDAPREPKRFRQASYAINSPRPRKANKSVHFTLT